MTIPITATNAPELLQDVLKAGLVPMITSSPGIGKSSIAQQIADKFRLLLIDLRLSQCDPTDLMGFPTIHSDGKKSGYVPMDTFPIESDPLPKDKDGVEMNGWLLLLDEANSAPIAVQAAAYKLVLDGMVGNHKLHPKVATMAAGNLMSDKAIVNRMSTAMQSRMVHFELALDNKAWTDWAHTAGIDHRIISYINFKPDALMKFDPNHNDHTFACPRTWHFLSKIIKPWAKISIDKLAILAGTVSEASGREFYGYCQVFESLPSLNDLLHDPENTKVSSEPSVLFAVSGLVSHHLAPANSAQLMKYIERLPVEFQIICLHGALRRDRGLLIDDALTGWIARNAQDLI